MKWQLGKFIDPTLSVYQRLVWVEDRPQFLATKYSVGVTDEIVAGPTEGRGFRTNVWGGDQIPMVAYLNQLELLNIHSEHVRTVWFREWLLMSGRQVQELSLNKNNEANAG